MISRLISLATNLESCHQRMDGQGAQSIGGCPASAVFCVLEVLTSERFGLASPLGSVPGACRVLFPVGPGPFEFFSKLRGSRTLSPMSRALHCRAHRLSNA